jgi:hypothetical protein
VSNPPGGRRPGLKVWEWESGELLGVASAALTIAVGIFGSAFLVRHSGRIAAFAISALFLLLALVLLWLAANRGSHSVGMTSAPGAGGTNESTPSSVDDRSKSMRADPDLVGRKPIPPPRGGSGE